MLLLELMKKFSVPDRNDPTKNVEVYRYVIDVNEKPMAIIWGKFSPWTGKNGHGRLVKFAEENFGMGNVIIASPKRSGNDPKVDIFTDDQKEKIIKIAEPTIKFLRLDTGFPPRAFSELTKMGIKRPVFIVGEDRINEFKKYFIKYNPENQSIEDMNDQNFGKGEYYYLKDRGKDNTSATKVRESLLKNNKIGFLQLTAYDEGMWNTMQNMLKSNKIITKESFSFDKFYYLTEGGNVVVKGESANKIPMDKITSKQFIELQEEILGALRALNKDFQDKYDTPLFPNFEENIKTRKLFSGSTRLFFDKPYEEFKRYKKEVGDIDLQHPEELKVQLKEYLDSVDGKKFGKMTYLGRGGNSPTQLNTIFRSSVAPDLIKNIQIDFEPTFFEKGIPNEFSTFAHYSSWEDIQKNIKGAFSKLLMRSLISAKQRLGDIAVITKTGKISSAKGTENPSLRKFSVDKGMRVAYEPILDEKGNIKRTDNGKQMFRELPTAESNYERNLDNIFAFAFDKKPKGNEKELFYSFIGILELMKKYLDNDTVKMIFSNFMRILWQEGQEIEQGTFNAEGIQEQDFGVKKAAYDQFIKVFPELKMSDKELKAYVLPFYQTLKTRKETKKVK